MLSDSPQAKVLHAPTDPLRQRSSRRLHQIGDKPCAATLCLYYVVLSWSVLARILCCLPNMSLVILTLLLMLSLVVNAGFPTCGASSTRTTRCHPGIPVDGLTADIRRYAELAISPSTRRSHSTGERASWTSAHCTALSRFQPRTMYWAGLPPPWLGQSSHAQ